MGNTIEDLKYYFFPTKSLFFCFHYVPNLLMSRKPYFPNRHKRERTRKRREEEEIVLEINLHPTIKTHDFLDAFTESIPLIIFNHIPSSHLFSSSLFISIFPSLEHMHLSIFLYFFIISFRIFFFLQLNPHLLSSFHLFSLSPFIL